MEDQDRDHISSRSHFSGRSEQELDEMLDELRAGKIGINQPGGWREAELRRRLDHDRSGFVQDAEVRRGNRGAILGLGQ